MWGNMIGERLKTSVLIPSLRRPQQLVLCLDSLAKQTILPDEVIVVWQTEDTDTRDAVLAIQASLPFNLVVLHSLQAGVVCSENKALEIAHGDIILLCDDDIIAPPTWISKHLAFYQNPHVGAVGSSANNHNLDGSLFPKRQKQPIGKLTWYGKPIGNMYDQIEEWQKRSPMEVDHLVGYNFSLRRVAFDRFEEHLKPYWQLFEMDACLQVKSKGFKVMFDFNNVVEHYPTNKAYEAGRGGDLQIKIFNGSYNHALILAKHSSRLIRLPRLLYLYLLGGVNSPGLLASLISMLRYRNPSQEVSILCQSLRHKKLGWQQGLAICADKKQI
jgi:glycosyltransferase involved in cell wall biosynthesis